LGLFTLSNSLLFDFISPLLLSLLLVSTVIRRRVDIFSIQYFICIFGTGLISLKRLEAVISLVEVSEETIVLRVVNDSSGEMGNIF
jgi:hypothetical protein